MNFHGLSAPNAFYSQKRKSKERNFCGTIAPRKFCYIPKKESYKERSFPGNFGEKKGNSPFYKSKIADNNGRTQINVFINVDSYNLSAVSTGWVASK